MIHSILIIGQSNMAGRGFIPQNHPFDNMGGRIKVLRNGRWQAAYRPFNGDRRTSGSCLAETFVTRYAIDHPDVSVGVIPAADGGTSLHQWQEGSLLFDNAVYATRLALRTSHLVAILWHQGESECSPERYPVYCEKFTAIVNALRRETGAEDIPLIVGGLGDFLADREESPNLGQYYRQVNSQLEQYAATAPYTAFVSAEGLGSNPDNLHFSHEALMEFGERYYSAFLPLENKDRVFDEKGKMDDAIRSAMEQL